MFLILFGTLTLFNIPTTSLTFVFSSLKKLSNPSISRFVRSVLNNGSFSFKALLKALITLLHYKIFNYHHLCPKILRRHLVRNPRRRPPPCRTGLRRHPMWSPCPLPLPLPPPVPSWTFSPFSFSYPP